MGAAAPDVNLKSNTMKNTLQKYTFLFQFCYKTQLSVKVLIIIC